MFMDVTMDTILHMALPKGHLKSRAFSTAQKGRVSTNWKSVSARLSDEEVDGGLAPALLALHQIEHQQVAVSPSSANHPVHHADEDAHPGLGVRALRPAAARGVPRRRAVRQLQPQLPPQVLELQRRVAAESYCRLQKVRDPTDEFCVVSPPAALFMVAGAAAAATCRAGASRSCFGR